MSSGNFLQNAVGILDNDTTFPIVDAWCGTAALVNGFKDLLVTSLASGCKVFVQRKDNTGWNNPLKAYVGANQITIASKYDRIDLLTGLPVSPQDEQINTNDQGTFFYLILFPNNS